MKRVLTALVLIPIVLLIVFKAPMWVFTIVAALFAVLAAWEYLSILEAYGFTGFKILCIALAIIFFTGITSAFLQVSAPVLRGTTVMLIAITLLATFLSLAAAMKTEDLRVALPSAACSLLVFPYVVLPVALLIALRTADYGWFFVLLLFFLVWSGDIFAYYVGKRFGKHKLAPRISPGKTVEGAIASVVGAIVVSIVLCELGPNLEAQLRAANLLRSNTVYPLSVPPGWLQILLAVCINVAAQFGDLAESMIKRGAGVKDSGTLMPGHGGVLDRIDALLFAAPVAAILFSSLSKYF